MSTQPAVSSAVESAVAAATAAATNNQPKKAKAQKILPTDRIQFSKQLDILRAYVIASGAENKVATNAEVGRLVQMVATTVAMGNAFFTDVGFLTRIEGGFLPSLELIAYNRAYEWTPEGSAVKLAPLLERSWFGAKLLPILRFRNSIPESEALTILADEAAASPHHRGQLETLIQYLDAAGLLQLDGEIVKAVKASTSSAPEKTTTQKVEQPATQQSQYNPPPTPSPDTINWPIGVDRVITVPKDLTIEDCELISAILPALKAFAARRMGVKTNNEGSTNR